MYSDESGHSKSEFYYPEEETLNQMTPINLFSKKKKKFIYRARSVLMGKNCAFRAVLKTSRKLLIKTLVCMYILPPAVKGLLQPTTK